MAYHFRFDPVDLLRCRFSLSPRWETQEAVRVLRDARRQAFHLPSDRGPPRPAGALRTRAPGHRPDRPDGGGPT